MKVDQMLRDLLFRRFRVGPVSFDFLEGLLAVCITLTGCMLRTPFEAGLPHWTMLLAEWYLAAAGAVLVWRFTGGRKRTLLAYGILLLLPSTVAEGTILRGTAGAGALFFLCALLFLGQREGETRPWLFTFVTAGLLLWSVRYLGLLFACMVLWQRRRLNAEQILLLLIAAGARFVYSYRIWFSAGYTLLTFHWPNIYEIVGREAAEGQLIDPAAYTGLFLTLGLMTILLWLFGQGARSHDGEAKEPSETGRKEGVMLLRLFLFFGLLANYFLPYMDQSAGCLYGVLAVLYAMLSPKEFPAAVLLQIVIYVGYQENFRQSSMMPMPLFAAVQFLVIVWLGLRALEDTGVQILCRRRS